MLKQSIFFVSYLILDEHRLKYHNSSCIKTDKGVKYENEGKKFGRKKT